MQKKALLALLLALTMMLSGCALIEKDMEVDRATEIIRVNDTVYTKGEIQDTVDLQLYYMASLYGQLGLSFDTTNAQNIADAQDSVIDSLIQNAVLADKAAELGMNQLTDEEQAEVAATAQAAWENDLDIVRSEYLADSELEGEELEAAVAEMAAELGASYELELETATNSYALQKLQASITDQVTVTDEELQAHLDEDVASAQSTYESNLSSYGISVNNGSTVYYRPAGYRMVKQILIQFDETDSSEISECRTNLNTANTAVTDAENVLYVQGIFNLDELLEKVVVTVDDETGAIEADAAAVHDELGDEISAQLRALAIARAQQEYYAAKLDEATQTAYANIAERADEVLAKLEAGEDWDELSAQYNDDPGMKEGAATAETGYAVCEGFTSFDAAFTAAAMAIPEVGQWSDKTEGSYGYYIIQYTSDVEEGPVSLEEVYDVVHEHVLSDKQTQAYNDQVAVWVEEANAWVDRNALNK